ncbi:MAG: hypothetical protein PHD11_05810 [Bacteroidales bacterium]|nr:hypothetical protein [Bacteroidales bacterium]MDD4670511.1 hypothetical protein [Bacteroidales bacterium]
MDIKELTQPIEDIGDSAKEYVNLKITEAKLKATKHAASSLNIIFAWLVVILASSLALLFLACSLAIWIGQLLGSQIFGFLIVGGALLIATVILFLCRKRLFVNGMVRTFVRILFENEDNEDDL